VLVLGLHYLSLHRRKDGLTLPLQIRLATIDDVEAIVGIYVATKMDSLPELIEDYDRNLSFLTNRWRSYIQEGSCAQMATGDSFTFLATANGQSVGFAAYHHTRRHDTQAELQSLYVRKEAQGHGIGTQLLHHIAVRLIEEGSTTMCVGYDPRNPYRRFYHKYGAVEINPHWSYWPDVRVIVPLIQPSG
jgi:GNAT superfamily N-acetyltransferase